MKKFLTLLLTALMAVACCFGLTACGDEEGGSSNVVDVTTKTITVGYTDYAPMNYTENGILKGFDTELALMVFNALGYEVRFKLIDWNNKYLELNGGTIDCIWNGFTANVPDDDGIQRADKVDFSLNYMQNAQCIVRKNAPEVNSWSDFAGKSVAFELSSAADSLISSKLENVNVNKKGVTSQMDAIREVNQGTANYAIVDILLAQSIVGTNDYAGLTINQGIAIDAEYYAIGFKKNSPLTAKVNIMLQAFAATGQLQELANKYGVGTSVITDFSSQLA